MTMISSIESIRNRITQAALRSGRDPSRIRLVAASKTVSVEKIKEAIQAGLTIFGENYIQEAKQKIDQLASEQISWHFIGHLQSNKAKYAVKLFDLIHSVDSFKLAEELSRQAKKIGKTQQILVQVDLGGEETKSGVSPDDLKPLLRDIIKLPNISLLGLMTLPPFYDDPEKVRPFFSRLRQLRDDINNDPQFNIRLEELSMGMSGDFEAAIEEGATLVRIGTSIFGKRT